MKNDPTAETTPQNPFTVMFEVDTLDRGGLENVVYDLVTGLNPSLFRCVVVCVNGGGHVADKLESKGAIVEILGGDEKEKAFFMLLDRYRVDLLFSHHSFFGTPLAHRMAVPVVSVLHNMYLWFDSDVLSIQREQDPFVNRYVAVSATVKDFSVKRFRLPSQKVTVIPNGMDLERLNAYAASSDRGSRRDWDLDDDDALFLNVAAITQVKNQNLIVEAARELVGDHPHIKIFLLGKTLTEGYRAFLKEKIDRYELNSNIRFIEFTDRIFDLYGLADAFLLPSFMEGWSLAAMEAHCFGLPLILSRVGGAEDLAAAGADVRFIDLYPEGTQDIHNETIFELAENADPEQVRALASVLRDIAESAKERRNSRGLDLELAQRFSKENMIHAYEKELLLAISETERRLKSGNGEDVRVRLEHLFRELYDQTQVLKGVQHSITDDVSREITENRRVAKVSFEEQLDQFQAARAERANLQFQLLSLEQKVDVIDAKLAQTHDQLVELNRKIVTLTSMSQVLLDRLSLKERFRALKRKILWKARVAKAPSPTDSILESEITADGFERYAVLCFPIIDWGYRFQRPQQILSRFALNGHPVIYGTVSLDINLKRYSLKTVAENVMELKLSSPRPLNIYKDHFTEDITRYLEISIEELMWEKGLTEGAILVQFPSWYPLARKLSKKRGWKLIYDCMDEHSGFDNVGGHFADEEKALLEESDLVIVSSEKLRQKALQFNENVQLIPNGAEFNRFAEPEPTKGLKIKHPIIGYFGALAEWFDYDALAYAADQHKDWNFLLIGGHHSSEIGKLEDKRNIQLTGELPYKSLPGYFAHFDVCLIPMRITPLIEATNPVKFFEYLCAGKPIVASDLPELRKFEGLFYRYTDKEDFIARIGQALREDDPQLREKRVQTARKNQWSDRYQAISTAIDDLFPLVSIMIPSYNNLNYLKLCLESIRRKSCYPNLEVIIVDNASGPETVAFLKEQEKEWPELTVVFNEKNAGFAGANNQAAQLAKGKYLALLNDDVMVTKGWLSGLLKYFRQNDVGMVGPVTNSCGNEACIDAPYKDVSNMEPFARQYTRENRDRFFEINVLAFFCTIMPKSVWDEVGPLDELYEIGMFEDDDYALRVREHGLKLLCAQDVFIHHFGRASFSRMKDKEYQRVFKKNKERFEKKWDRPWVPHKYL